MIEELSIFSCVFLIPRFSIISVVSLKPAVSVKRNLIPSITTVSSMASLVVPGISETIAFSSFSKRFSNVDFPVFGFPAITTGTPSFTAFPRLKDDASFSEMLSTLSTISTSLLLSANSTSSSPKSSSSSINDAKCNKSALSMLISSENEPRS